MKITVREATKNDISELLELIKQMTNYHCNIDKYYKPFSKYEGLSRHIKDQLNDKEVKILVAIDREKIIGHIIGVVTKAPPYIAPKVIGNIDDTFICEE